MNADESKSASARAARTKRSAKAHWLLAGVTRRQAELHRELAGLLDKEAEAHTVLDRWAREGATRQATEHDTDVMLRWGKEHLKQVVVAKQEAAAHRDLAQRSDARTLWHKTVAVLLMRSAESGGGTVPEVTPEDADAATASASVESGAAGEGGGAAPAGGATARDGGGVAPGKPAARGKA
jgi:hypothetical protein